MDFRRQKINYRLFAYFIAVCVTTEKLFATSVPFPCRLYQLSQSNFSCGHSCSFLCFANFLLCIDGVRLEFYMFKFHMNVYSEWLPIKSGIYNGWRFRAKVQSINQMGQTSQQVSEYRNLHALLFRSILANRLSPIWISVRNSWDTSNRIS